MSEFTCAKNHLIPSSIGYCIICQEQGLDGLKLQMMTEWKELTGE